jgi:type VI protein secretion system component Hcp
MFMNLHRVLPITATVGSIALLLGASSLFPALADAQTRPSLAGLQQQIDALQARLDSRLPTAGVYSGASVFLLIPTIPGDSTDSQHADWIDGLAFGMGGSHGDGSPEFDEFVVIKQLDGATTGLLAAARDGTLLASATVDVCTGAQCPLRFDLTNVIVTSVSPGVTETLTLAYASISQTFSPASGPPSVSSGVLDVGSLGGLIVGFDSADEGFALGSGNVDEIFVQFDGIAGSSQDTAHSDWSDALAFSGGNLAAAPVAELGKFEVFKAVDKATPLLLKALVENTVLTTLKVELCEAGPTLNCFMIYEFSNARLTRISSVGENEEVSFDFELLTQTFHSPGGDQIFVFDPSP